MDTHFTPKNFRTRRNVTDYYKKINLKLQMQTFAAYNERTSKGDDIWQMIKFSIYVLTLYTSILICIKKYPSVDFYQLCL